MSSGCCDWPHVGRLCGRGITYLPREIRTRGCLLAAYRGQMAHVVYEVYGFGILYVG